MHPTRILILGGGFGGVYTALEMEKHLARRTGVANVFGIRFSGFVAWWLWRTIYLSKLPRLEKKVRVALDWTLDLCFAKDFACTAPQAQAAGAGVRVEITAPGRALAGAGAS
jgi:NADH dehydrogenase FAD-containing subunit